MIRALIVDDEPPARRKLRDLLRAHADVQLVRECANGLEAVDAIGELRPDLMFLDVQMPALSGFDVLEAAGGERLPATIFVTAFDEYALRAFDVHAVDYLLKPVVRERFDEALERARARIAAGRDPRTALLDLLADERLRGRWLERVVVRDVGHYSLLPVEEIDWIEAADNYARVYAGAGQHLVRMTLQELERRLDPQRFVRVHRSAIVAIDRIRHIEPWSHGDYRLILSSGARVTASRTYEAAVRRILGE